jgi:hypothetical protein
MVGILDFLKKQIQEFICSFFLDLFKQVYDEECQVGSLEESNVLCEFCMLIQTKSKLKEKKWKHTFLYSGESDLRECKLFKNEYDCILCMERNHKNIVNVPLHIAYIYTNKFKEKLETTKNRDDFPTNDVLAIISNPNGKDRNTFLEKLEKKLKVTYAGRYKTNINRISSQYNTEEFSNVVSQFKFIISMENARYDTGITEKIVHGMMAQTIPIYWGSERVNQYFNSERFLNLTQANEEMIDELINKIIDIKNTKEKWLNIVNKKVFPENGKLWRTMENIAKDIRCLFSKKPFDIITKINVISNPEYELDRYNMMKKLMNDLNIKDDFVEYIAPTYSHTIDEETYNHHSSPQMVLRMRKTVKLKTAELSLILNIKQNLEFIVKNFKDGIFILFESDIILGKDINKFEDFLNEIKDKNWDCIHLGMFYKNIFDLPVTNWITGYRNYNEPFNNLLTDFLKLNCKEKKYIEDIKQENDKFRLIRKFHPRCTDSLLWTYKGIEKYLNFINKMEKNLSCPADYLLTHFLENNIDFRHYWSVDEFFKQASNLKIVKSKIQ